MKCIYTLIMITALSFISSLSYASNLPDPKKLNCKQVGNSTQCMYRVIGQSTKKINSVSNLYGITNMPYALCASALCTINVNNPQISTCICNVYGKKSTKNNWRAASVGPMNYKKSKPSYKNGKLIAVTSNFSFAHATNNPKVTNIVNTRCDGNQNSSWANCFGIRCKVFYKKINGKQTPMANCQCPIVTSKSFISTGPKTTKQCITQSNKVWSAATPQQGKNDFGVIKNIYKQYY